MKKYYDIDLISDIDYAIDRKMFDAAKKKIFDYQELYPNDTRIKISILKYYNAIRDYQSALNYALDNLNANFRDNQSYAKFYCEFAACLIALKKYEEAIKYLNNAVRMTGGKYYHIIYMLAEAYSLNGQFERAVNLYIKYMDEKNCDYYYLNLSKLYFLNKDYKQSILFGNKSRDVNLKNLQIQKKYYYLGKSSFELHRYEDAEKYLKKVLSVKNVRYYSAYFALAKIYYRTGRIEEATSICEEMTKNNVADSGVYNLLSKLYGSSKNIAKANELLDHYDNDEKEYYMGDLALKTFRYEDAINHFTKYLESNDDYHNEKAFYKIIVAKFRLGLYEEVLDLIEKFSSENMTLMQDVKRMKFYSKNVLGQEIYPESYVGKQIINYSEKEAVAHVFYRHVLNKGFKDGVDLKKLFVDVKDMLNKDKLCVVSAFDVYRLDINNLGDDKNKTYNTLEVICLPNTSNILTMYPNTCSNIENDELDINNNDFKKEKKVQL